MKADSELRGRAQDDREKLSYYPFVADYDDTACRQITVLEKCGACASVLFTCSKFNVDDPQPQLDPTNVCTEIKRT